MNKQLIKFILIASTLFLVQVMSPAVSSADGGIGSETELNTTNFDKYQLDKFSNLNENSMLLSDNLNSEVSVMSSNNRILITFKGITVAALQGGIILYFSSKAPAEWVAWGLTSIETKIKNFARSVSYIPGKPIYVASNGNISACAVYPCAVRNSIKPIEIK